MLSFGLNPHADHLTSTVASPDNLFTLHGSLGRPTFGGVARTFSFPKLSCRALPMRQSSALGLLLCFVASSYWRVWKGRLSNFVHRAAWEFGT